MTVVYDSPITRAIVYAQGARVTRRVRVHRQDGQWPSQIEVPGLPLSLEDTSVRLSCTHPGVLISQGRVGIHAARQSDPIETIEESALHALRQDLESAQRDAANLDAEIGYYEKFSVPARPQTTTDRPPPASPIAARLALAELVDQSIEQRLKQKSQVRERILELERQVAHAQDTLRRASQSKHARVEDLSKSFQGTLRCDAQDAQHIDCILTYFVPGATWVPQYTCRINQDGTHASMVMRALVIQHTGEDWRGVRLSVSTADASAWSQIPKLKSIRIGRAQARGPQAPGFRAPPSGAQRLFADMDQAVNTLQAQLTPHAHGHTSRPLHTVPSPEPIDELWREIEDITGHSLGGSEGMMLGMAAGGSAPMPIDEMEEMDDDAYGGSFGLEVAAPAHRQSYSSAPAMAPPSPVMAAPRKKRARMAKESMPSSAPSQMPMAPSEAAPSSDHSTARYGMLHLGKFDVTGQRNALQQTSREDLYARSFARAGLEGHFDLGDLVAQAHVRAMQASAASLPSGAVALRQAAGVFDYVYHTRDTVDVPSDLSFHGVFVSDVDMGCSMRYVVVPREDTQVYRMAKLSNQDDGPLLAGPCEVYVGGTYVLTATLHTVPPGGQVELGLGVEQGIRCARNTRYEERRSGQAVVATNDLWHHITIDVRNHLQRDVPIEIRERIPQPETDAEVVVETQDIEPMWEVYKQEHYKPLEGGRAWNINVEAKSTKQVKASYVVKIYANNELVGGNRREQ